MNYGNSSDFINLSASLEPNILRLSKFFEKGWKPTELSDYKAKKCIPGSCVPGVAIKGSKDCRSDDCLKNKREEIARYLKNVLSSNQYAFTYSIDADRPYRYSLKKNDEEKEFGARLPNIDIDRKEDSYKKVNMRTASIIGIGDWGSIKHQDDKCTNNNCKQAVTKFAWAILPQSAGADGELAQLFPQHYPTSAHISLPGWWKKARIDVTTCWVRNMPSASSVETGTLCPNSLTNKHEFIIDVPGDISDLMQALRFEIVRYPYIEASSAESQQTVEIGRPASIVIKGLRLWRSPSVWLNNQKADLVETLPTMKGIIATFNCVNPKPGTTGTWELPVEAENNRNSLQVRAQFQQPFANVEVFTSEGSTSASDLVQLVPFVSRYGGISSKQEQQSQVQKTQRSLDAGDYPCWLKSK